MQFAVYVIPALPVVVVEIVSYGPIVSVVEVEPGRVTNLLSKYCITFSPFGLTEIML